MTTATIDFAGQRARLVADRAEAEEARKRASLDNLAGKGDGALKVARDRLAAIDEQIADLDAAEQGVRETEARTADAAAAKADREARAKAMKAIDGALVDRAKAGKMIDDAITQIGKAMVIWTEADDTIDQAARLYKGDYGGNATHEIDAHRRLLSALREGEGWTLKTLIGARLAEAGLDLSGRTYGLSTRAMVRDMPMAGYAAQRETLIRSSLPPIVKE